MNKIKNNFANIKVTLNRKIKDFKWSKMRRSFKESIFFLKKNLRLLLTSVFKSLKIYVYVFIIPLILSIVLFSYQSYAGESQPLPPIVAGYLLIPGFGLLLGVNNLISEWKASIFLKRINLIGTTKTQFLLSIWIIGYLLGLISTIFCTAMILLYAKLLNSNSFIEMFTFLGYGAIDEVIKNWFAFLLGISTVILSSIGLSTLISGAFRSIALIQSLGILVVVFTFVFSDLFLNPVMLANIKGLVILSYFVPQKYGAWTVFYAVADGNRELFLPRGAINAVISFESIKWPIINGLLYCLGLFVVSLFTFRWNNRG